MHSTLDSASADAALVRALAGVARAKEPARLAASLARRRSDLARSLQEAVVAAIPAFSVSANPELLPDLARHVGEHIAELLRLLGGGAVRDFEFVRAYARRRAAQRFPIEATLQAYRCTQPVFAAWLQGGPGRRGASPHEPTAAALAGLVTEYTHATSIAFAAEYLAHTSVLAEAEGDRRTELLSLLVGGYDESDARVARLLKRAGYLEQRLSFCVALAQSTDPLEMENPARAQRIADALVECVAALPVRVLVGVRSSLVTAVFSDTRRASGWTAPQASLAERVGSQLLALGPAVLIGLSGDQPSTSLIPRGLHEATVALDFADVTARVVPFHTLSIRRLLIHRGAEYVQSALPAWLGLLRQADAKSRGQLLKTLRVFADADMNIQRASRELHVHANTIYARIQRVNDLTGLDPHHFHDLTHLLLALDCGRA